MAALIDLPSVMERLLKIDRQIAQLLRRRPEVGARNLDELDDVEVLSQHPGLSPRDGAVLSFTENPSVPVYGGLWKPRNLGEILAEFTWSSTEPIPGGAASITSADVDGAFDTSGIWAVEVYVSAGTLPANTTGAGVTAEVFGHRLTVRCGIGGGSNQGSWLGTDGAAGAYGWQAEPFVMSQPSWAGGVIAVQGGSGLAVYAGAYASVLDDPGSSAVALGGPDATATALDYTVQVNGIRLL